MEKNDFYEIFRKYASDKVTHHGYHMYYPQFIEKFRNSSDAMIEIGIQDKNSLYSWFEYFPNAFIYGVDIGVEESGKKYRIAKADQSSGEQLDQFIKSLKHKIFFINDDGSHIPEHQLLTFSKLFGILQPGGVYIIEDVETSYWSNGGLFGYIFHYGFRHQNSIVEVFKNILDYLNYEFLTPKNRQLLSQLLPPVLDKTVCRWINTITFCQNCIIITKKTEEQLNYYNRHYRFNGHL